MITIKLLGGARKSFGTDSLQMEGDGITVRDIIEWLLSSKPKDTPRLDADNMLVAINGADSSASGGRDAVLHSGDVVSIIPVIHGGAQLMRCQAGGRTVHVFGICRGGADLLDELRVRFPGLALQAVSSRYVLGVSHVQKILQVSLEAKRRGIMLSKKLETDMLMRFAGTTQISRAIERAGAGRERGGFFLIAVGGTSALDRLHTYIGPRLGRVAFARPGSRFLTGEFGITGAQVRAVDSPSPLEDLLAERAAVLF